MSYCGQQCDNVHEEILIKLRDLEEKLSVEAQNDLRFLLDQVQGQPIEFKLNKSYKVDQRFFEGVCLNLKCFEL
jgi:hypothetical protein